MLFTFPSRYLFTIGHSVVLSLGEWSPHFQTEFLVLRPTQELNCFLPILDYHHLRSAFPRCSSSYNQIHRLVRFRSPLLSESRQVLRCFSSLRSLRNTMYSCYDTDCSVGFPIRTFTDQCLFTTPRDFSQCITSFFASECQGIHQMPFHA